MFLHNHKYINNSGDYSMIVYKYSNLKGAIETIKGNSVLLDIPENYNDPFDCDIFTTDEEEKKAYELFVNYQMFKALYDSISTQTSLRPFANTFKKELLFFGKEIKKDKKFESQPYLFPLKNTFYKSIKKSKAELQMEFKDMLKDVYKKIKSSVIVSCFGSSNDQLLMWAHYADKHRGACLEFEIDDKDFKAVEYDKKKPEFELYKTLQIIFGHQFVGEDIDVENEKYSFLYKPLLTKSLDWEYEGEIRCVYSLNKRDPKIYEGLNDKGETILLLKMPKIKAIYIGCKMDNNSEKTIRECSGDIPIYKMKKKNGEYGLEPETI